MAATVAATETAYRGIAAALVEFRPVFMTLFSHNEMIWTEKIATGIWYR
jgi:hypothetical protein